MYHQSPIVCSPYYRIIVRIVVEKVIDNFILKTNFCVKKFLFSSVAIIILSMRVESLVFFFVVQV